jgi:hypothetical protein
MSMLLLQQMSELKERKSRPLNNESGLEIMEAGLYATLVILASLVSIALIGPVLGVTWGTIAAAV